MTLKKLAVIGVALAGLAACNKTQATSADTATPAQPAASQAAASQPAGSPQRIRGTLQAIKPTALTIQTYGGDTVSAPINAKTAFVWVAASSLSTLKTGDFIGTATTGPDTALRAVELVIFPNSMRGAGEGHYGWDTPGVVASKGGAAGASSSMTNGTVQQSSMTNGTVQQSSMTNGTVAAGAGKPGEKTLSISYKGGVSQVLVPAGAPVVRFEPTQKSVLALGQKVFIVIPPGADGAKFVAIGKDGVVPPM